MADQSWGPNLSVSISDLPGHHFFPENVEKCWESSKPVHISTYKPVHTNQYISLLIFGNVHIVYIVYYIIYIYIYYILYYTLLETSIMVSQLQTPRTCRTRALLRCGSCPNCHRRLESAGSAGCCRIQRQRWWVNPITWAMGPYGTFRWALRFVFFDVFRCGFDEWWLVDFFHGDFKWWFFMDIHVISKMTLWI